MHVKPRFVPQKYFSINPTTGSWCNTAIQQRSCGDLTKIQQSFNGGSLKCVKTKRQRETVHFFYHWKPWNGGVVRAPTSHSSLSSGTCAACPPYRQQCGAARSWPCTTCTRWRWSRSGTWASSAPPTTATSSGPAPPAAARAPAQAHDAAATAARPRSRSAGGSGRGLGGMSRAAAAP